MPESPTLPLHQGCARRPFDRIVEVDRLGERPRLALAGRLAAAAPVDTHGGVALRHPPFRIDRLPVHPRVRLLLEGRRRNPELVFLVGPEIEDGRKASAVIGTEHVGLEPRAVPHRHLDVLLDQDAVGRSRNRLDLHEIALPRAHTSCHPGRRVQIGMRPRIIRLALRSRCPTCRMTELGAPTSFGREHLQLTPAARPSPPR